MTIKQGPIKLGADVALELGLPVTGKLTLGDARVRTLAGKPSGPLKLSDLNGKSAYPPAGTLLSTFCSGFNKMGRYANGSGGTYDQLIQANSAECGYAPGQFTMVAGAGVPSYAPGITGYSISWGAWGPSFGSLVPGTYKGARIDCVTSADYTAEGLGMNLSVFIYGLTSASALLSISINGGRNIPYNSFQVNGGVLGIWGFTPDFVFVPGITYNIRFNE